MRAYAVVYLEDGPKSEAPIPPVTITQKAMAFIPFVSVVPAGGKVTFINRDPFPHNVFSPDNERFNLGKWPSGSMHTRAFAQAGTYRLLCNLHPNMLGFVLVVPSTHFAKVKRDGTFSIEDIPNGTYHVTAWAPQQAPAGRPVTVAGTDVQLELHLTKETAK